MSANVCPCCGRKIVAKRTGIDKRLAQDLAKAEFAMGVCERTMTRFDLTSEIQMAAIDEFDRLQRATVDHRLLWAIYRRAGKANSTPYYQLEPELAEVAA